uniref:Uncharacterized protein n=1 Tax=Rhizophora mucronata TaxID=61149 RepID=A0A2P2P7R8_RHIMU
MHITLDSSLLLPMNPKPNILHISLHLSVSFFYFLHKWQYTKPLNFFCLQFASISLETFINQVLASLTLLITYQIEKRN